MECRLDQLLDRQGFTRGQLAEATGLSPSYLSLLANGRRFPTLQTAHAIALVLGVRVDTVWRPHAN